MRKINPFTKFYQRRQKKQGQILPRRKEKRIFRRTLFLKHLPAGTFLQPPPGFCGMDAMSPPWRKIFRRKAVGPGKAVSTEKPGDSDAPPGFFLFPSFGSCAPLVWERFFQVPWRAWAKGCPGSWSRNSLRAAALLYVSSLAAKSRVTVPCPVHCATFATASGLFRSSSK